MFNLKIMYSILLSVLFFTVYANPCDQKLAGLSVHNILYADLSPIEGVALDAGAFTKVTDQELSTIVTNQLIAANCKDYIYRLDFTYNRAELSAFYTNAYACDRGETQGIVKDANGKIIAKIDNGLIRCL